MVKKTKWIPPESERRDVCMEKVADSDIILWDMGELHRFRDYWSLMDYIITQTFDTCVNCPEEYDALDIEERKKLDAVHAAWIPKL